MISESRDTVDGFHNDVPDHSLTTLDNGVSSVDNDQVSKSLQKNFVINGSEKYRVASKNEKYVLTKKTLNSTRVRTSALSNSLKVSKVSNSSLETQGGKKVNGSTNGTSIRSNSGENMLNGDTSAGDLDLESRDTVPKLRGTESKSQDIHRKLSGYNRVTEQPLSRSLPAYRNAALESNLRESPSRNRSNQGHVYEQGKSRQNTNSNATTQNSGQQGSTPTSLSRSPTPKIFFSNLMNRLGSRLSGNSQHSSSEESPSSSSASSRASTPTVEQNVVLSFRLSADEFQTYDHKLKLYFELSLFRWTKYEEFSCLLKVSFFPFWLKVLKKKNVCYVKNFGRQDDL